MSLHLVFSAQGWQACLPRRQKDDVVVLIGDGVYTHSDVPNGLIIAEDLTVRGLSAPASQRLINYETLVELCTQHHPVVSWHG